MQSLGSILQRIVQTSSRPRLTDSQTSELVTVDGDGQVECQKCNGDGWLSYGVHLGEPHFGEAHPCSCTGWYEGVERDRIRERDFENFPHKKDPRNFKNFEKNTSQRQELFEKIFLWVLNSERAHLLTLAGPNGTGKSHSLEAIARYFFDAGWTVQFHNMGKLAAEFRGLVAEKKNLDEKYASLAVPELLVIDDITERGTDFTAEVLENILEPRYQGRGYLVVGTNIPDTVMAEVWGFRLADRIFDLHSGDTELIYVTGSSARTGRHWPEIRRKTR